MLNKHNIKIIIFFKVVEYWIIKEEQEIGNNMNYSQNPAREIKIQIINSLKSMHDI